MNDQLTFLQSVKPFNTLPEEVTEGVLDLLEEITYTRDTVIYMQDVSKMRGLDIIVEGEYEIFFYDSEQNKRLVEYRRSGTSYGGSSVLLNKKKSIRSVIAKKGTRIFFLHRRHFRALCSAYESFFQYYTVEYGKRMLNDEYAHFVKPSHRVEENYIAADQLYSRKIETLEPRAIVACSEQTLIFEAARMMQEQKVSCLFVRNELQTIVGFITDITLRDKVIAQQVNVQQPVAGIMDRNIVSINEQEYVYEAILLMFQTKTRYLLIEKNGGYTGFISRNKLLSEQAQSPFMFIQSVRLALSADELKRKWERVPEIVYQLLNRGVKAEIVNEVISTVSDTIAQKVIEGVIAEMGPPPAKFVFMVLGSEGRKEQTLNTDQDNAIIYEDKANEQRELVRDYFLQFADQVSERLNHIGFRFCEGGFMAKNPKWTHSLSHWKRNYQTWMAESNQQAVMNIATFFDCRGIYGEQSIILELKEFLNQELQKPLDKFLYSLAQNALQYEPTLTFFNNIRTFAKGSQQVFDIKKTMTPIVDLVRVFALKNRVFLTNTGERMEALKAAGVFTEKDYQELLQAYYYLMGMRLKRQAMQIMHDKAQPDNFIDPSKMTKIEQVTLKEIFKVISHFQLNIKVEFTKALY